MSKWQATDILYFKGSPVIRVRRLLPLGRGNRGKGTEHGVVYWIVETSPRFRNKTGIHTISMVPETRLKPLT